jgi:hypothetical protein
MLDGVVMNVGDVPLKIEFVLKVVLPEPPLPDPVLSFTHP